MAVFFIGVDLGGTNVKVCLVDVDGSLVGQESTPSQIEAGPNALVERVSVSIEKIIAVAGIAKESLKGMGIASPGPLSVAQGKIIKAGNLPGFDNFPLRAALSRRLGVPAVFDNDANVACWGEFWRGAGRGMTDMIMLTLGTGVGGGIICQGELVHGSEDNGGELGHMILVPEGRLCSCGQRGCLEAYASASHTAVRAQEALKTGRASQLQKITTPVTCKDVFVAAAAGDALANEIVDGTARALAQACVTLRHITEPQMVVFSGGMINAGTMLLDRIQREYERFMWTLKPEPMRLVFAQLGDAAGMIGAAGLALHHYERNSLYPVGQ